MREKAVVWYEAFRCVLRDNRETRKDVDVWGMVNTSAKMGRANERFM